MIAVPDPSDDLQFERAEYADPNAKRCAICKNAIADSYYQLAGHDVCPACAVRFRDANRPGGHAELVRSTLFGLAGAAAGWALYATVSAVSHMQFSILAIAVGWLVGKAMRKGSNGAGGRKFQIVAVLLTYAAITTSYIPEVFIAAGKRAKAEQNSAVTTAPPRVTPGQVAKATVALVAICFAAPFLGIASGSGILNVIIIGIGLMQAWRAMRVVQAHLAGPYSVQSS
jgi:hypothetical protein